MVVRRSFFVIAALAVGLVLAPFALRSTGTWLVVSDPLQPARAVVVFGGQLPFRAMEAAAIYKSGSAREVWLTRGGMFEEDLAMAQLGIDKPPEYFYSQKVLEHLGVPASAIRVLPELTPDTAAEVRVVQHALQATGGNRVIVVTSKYHTRRVKMMWRTLVGARPEAIVRYASDDPFEPARWWRNTKDALAVAREWFGILNALAGFPIKSVR
jgi:uncharacterized SAM-binding protein YcdF (DUF218 family)